MGAFRDTSLRVLAPASLVVFAIVLLIVVIASLSGGDDSSGVPVRASDDHRAAKARHCARPGAGQA